MPRLRAGGFRVLNQVDLPPGRYQLRVAAREGAIPRVLETNPGTDASPAWSPDGKWVAYVAGGDPKDFWYGTSHVALAPVAGGASRRLTASLDRNVASPRFTPDGRAVRAKDGVVQGAIPGTLPESIAIDRDGAIYAGETTTGRILRKFARQ